MIRVLLLAAISAAFLGGCTYEVKTAAAPALNVYSSFGDKLPGAYAVLVKDDILYAKVDPSSHLCSAHVFPIDARTTFKDSAIQTIVQLVERAEAVDQPLTQQQLRDQNYRGQIVIKAEEYDPRLTFIDHFWTTSTSSTVEIVASLLVDGPDGRLLGTKVTESRTADFDKSGCGAGVDALAKANAKAMEAVLDRLGERLSNEPRLRTTAAAN